MPKLDHKKRWEKYSILGSLKMATKAMSRITSDEYSPHISARAAQLRIEIAALDRDIRHHLGVKLK